MAKIDIKYSSGDLASTSGSPEAKPLDLSPAINATLKYADQMRESEREKKRLEEAARDTNYYADSIVKMNSELQKIKSESAELLHSDPDTYSKTVLERASAMLQPYVDSAPSDKAKMAMMNQVAQMKIHLGLNTENNASEAKQVKYKSQFFENMDQLSAGVFNNPESLGEARVQRLALLEAYKTVADPAEVAAADQVSSDRLDLTFLQGFANKNPEETIKAIRGGNFNHLGAEKLAQVEHSAYQEIETRMIEAEKIKNEQHQELVLNYKSRLAMSRDLKSADTMVDEILKNRDVLGKNFPALLNEAYSNYDSIKSKQEEVVRVATFIDNGIKLEPGNKKDEERADIAFDQFRDKYNDAEPQDKVQIISAFLDRVGVLPPSVEKGLFNTLRSGDAKSKVAAAITVDSLITQDPRITRQFSGRIQDVALASKIADNIAYKMSPEDAVKSAEIDVFEGAAAQATQDPRRQAKIKLYDANRTPITLSDFTEAFRDDPDEVPAEMLAELEDYKRQLAVNFGVPERRAHERAIELGKARWGVTEINGVKEFTRNPPEKVFSTGSDNSWIRKQLHREVGAVGRTIDGKKIDPENIIIKPVPEFLNKSKVPVYSVLYDDGSGIPQPVLKENKQTKTLTPFVWHPSASTTNAAAKVSKISDERVKLLNDRANASAKYRVRQKLLHDAMNDPNTPEATKERLRRDIFSAVPKEGTYTPTSTEELKDIKPVKLSPRDKPNLRVPK